MNNTSDRAAFEQEFNVLLQTENEIATRWTAIVQALEAMIPEVNSHVVRCETFWKMYFHKESQCIIVRMEDGKKVVERMFRPSFGAPSIDIYRPIGIDLSEIAVINLTNKNKSNE